MWWICRYERSNKQACYQTVILLCILYSIHTMCWNKIMNIYCTIVSFLYHVVALKGRVLCVNDGSVFYGEPLVLLTSCLQHVDIEWTSLRPPDWTLSTTDPSPHSSVGSRRPCSYWNRLVWQSASSRNPFGASWIHELATPNMLSGFNPSSLLTVSAVQVFKTDNYTLLFTTLCHNNDTQNPTFIYI